MINVRICHDCGRPYGVALRQGKIHEKGAVMCECWCRTFFQSPKRRQRVSEFTDEIEAAECEYLMLRLKGIERHQIFAVCEVMEQGPLNSPIAAYSDIEHARSVASQNSNDQRSFTVVEIPFFMRLGAFSE